MSFDLVAPYYRWMEVVLAGQKLQRCRTSFLQEISHAESVLLIGEGPGRFLVESVARWPDAQITYVDASRRMLESARHEVTRRNLNPQRMTFVHDDILDWASESNAFDVIATHFFLDCFAPQHVRSIVQKLSVSARPSTSWLLSDFQIPPSGLRRWRASMILRLMYAFFRAATRVSAKRLTEPDEFLREGGFRLRARRVSEWGLLRSDHWIRGEAHSSTSTF